MYVLYALIKRLSTPFRKWEAFKEGVIDKNGSILVDKKFRNRTQNKSFSKLDNTIRKMKLLINRLPGGRKITNSYGAALWLMREQFDAEGQLLTEEVDIVPNSLLECISLFEEDGGIPANNTTNVAGLDGDPPVGKKAQAAIVRRKKKRKDLEC